jgi:predicted ferric reductase
MNTKYIFRIWGLFLLFLAALFLPFFLPILRGVEGASFPQPFTLFGILSYAFMAFDVILGTRFAFFERGHGLSEVYFHHGLLGLGAVICAVVHVIYSFLRDNYVFELNVVRLLGYIALVLLIAVIFSGMLILSCDFIRRSAFFMKLKERVFNREVGLFIHRAAFISTLFMFWHIILTRTASNEFFRAMLIATFALSMLLYAASKIKRIAAPKYVLQDIEELPGGCYNLLFKPLGARKISYKAGQYVFVRFIDSELPRESHPFSFTSYPTEGEQGFSIMVKESGDYTDRASKLKPGDVAKIEGPYGIFPYAQAKHAGNPLILIGGGVGITPMISLLNEMLTKDEDREIVLLWGINTKDEIFYEDYYESLMKSHDRFRYHITIADEKVDGYGFGFVNQPFLEESGVDMANSEADFYICGPLAMMDSIEKILRANGVAKARIHTEKFSF